MSHEHLEKKVSSAVVKWRGLYVSVRSCSLTTLFTSSLFLLIFFLEILSVAERSVLKSATIPVDLSIFPFNSVRFASWIFRLCYLLCTYIFRIDLFYEFIIFSINLSEKIAASS